LPAVRDDCWAFVSPGHQGYFIAALIFDHVVEVDKGFSAELAVGDDAEDIRFDLLYSPRFFGDARYLSLGLSFSRCDPHFLS